MKDTQKPVGLFYKALLICLAWLIVTVPISTMTFLNQIQGNISETLSISSVILFEVICIIPWIISTPLIIWVTRKYRLEKKQIRVSLPVHILVALFIFCFHSITQSYTVTIFYDYSLSWSYIQRDLVGFLDMRLLLYTGVVLGVYAIDFQRKNRESKMKEPRLKAQLNKARYHALLNQIQPTFLLNSIDSIREKIRNNPDKSEEVLTRFSDLLRIMLQNANREEITIKEDLESYYLYLNLLEKRLGTNIEKKVSVKEVCYEALVPAYLVYLMLILLVEEIILTEPRSIAGIEGICYSAKRVYNMVNLEIRIEGLELTPPDLRSYLRGAHFEDARQQLQNKYGNDIDLQISTTGRRVKTSFQIPYRTQEESELSFDKTYTYAEDNLRNQLTTN